MFGLGLSEILIILFIIILLFGSRKLPELAKGLGKSISEFKKGMKETDEQTKPNDSNKDKKNLAG
jgi:TatA/E family protein of Tat protein translocase